MKKKYSVEIFLYCYKQKINKFSDECTFATQRIMPFLSTEKAGGTIPKGDFCHF